MATLKVLSAGAVKRGVAKIAADFGRATGHTVNVEFTPVPQVRKRIAGGETPDVVVATPAAMDEFAAAGRIVAASRGAVGRSRMGVVVHADAAEPVYSDSAGFRAALLAATHVVYNQASSGVYVAGLLEKLGIVGELGSRVVVVKGGADVMEFVGAQPPGAVGFGQVSEAMVLIDKGCRVKLGSPLPADVQNVTSYEAAAIAASPAADAAAALAREFTSPAAKSIFAATGID